VASLLWRLAPAAYLAQVRRRFADDLGESREVTPARSWARAAL
jgi:hypothetical protein